MSKDVFLDNTLTSTSGIRIIGALPLLSSQGVVLLQIFLGILKYDLVLIIKYNLVLSRYFSLMTVFGVVQTKSIYTTRFFKYETPK